jgi:hypothetical protein
MNLDLESVEEEVQNTATCSPCVMELVETRATLMAVPWMNSAAL